MADQRAETKPSKKTVLDFIAEAFGNCFKICSKNKIDQETTEEVKNEIMIMNNEMSQSHIPVIYLTEREIYNFEKIWKLVQKNLSEIGKKLFIRLFTSHPELSKYFDKFRGLDGEQLTESVALEVHGMVVMSTLDEIVSHLDEGPELIWEILKELGDSHAKFGSQLKSEDFWSIEEALIESVNENLGGLKPNAMKLLRKTIRFLISGIVQGMEDELKRIKADGKERAATDIRGSEHSHKRLDLSEMIEKDMEEKIHQNEILHHKNHHHHRHHHHHHGHHHHHEHHHGHHGHHHEHHHGHHHHHKHGSTQNITDSSSNVGDWMVTLQSHSSGLLTTNPTISSVSHSVSGGSIYLQPMTENKSHNLPDVE